MVPGTDFRRQLLGDAAVERHLSGPAHASAPELTRYIDDNLFGEVWQQPGLSSRERALVTVSAFAALGLTAQLRTYVGAAQRLGVERDALIQTIVQLAFYIGFPAAGNALGIVVEATQPRSDESSEGKEPSNT